MKQRKVFIGISVPEKAARRLQQKVAPWHHLPLRWVKERNYHVTLDFLGHIDDDAVAEVCERVAEVCDVTAPFDVLLEKIALAPQPGRDAKTLWLSGEANEELLALRQAIGEALRLPSKEHHSFEPHVTLGRVREKQWQTLEPIPTLEGKFGVLIPVESVTVFESVFESGVGLVYEPLGVYDLNGE